MNDYPEELKAFAARLPVPLYAVGGCVRDALLGNPVHDIDLCSALLPEQIRSMAAEAGYACPVVNRRLGTVLLCIGEQKYEHTTFRTESYPAGGGHAPCEVAFTDEIEADAHRRDFSINAIYENVASGALVDPTGGVKDIENRVLRTTTDDPVLILRDDGLRILRLVRFAVSTGFAVDAATWECAKEHVLLLDGIAWERKRQELDRILLLDDVLRALHLMQQLGAWAYLIPELSDAAGIMQRAQYHRYDVLDHSFHVCAEMPKDVPLRLMGLLHDVGKPKSLSLYGHFHEHAQLGAQMTGTILRRLTYPNAFIKRVSQAVAFHMFDLDECAKVATVRLRFVQIGRQGVEDFLLLRQADVRGSGIQTAYTPDKWRAIYEKMLSDGCPWSISELRITGREVCETCGTKPSPLAGRVLYRLWQHCVKRPADNRPERLKRLARDCMDGSDTSPQKRKN